jgi:hypothetical protein
VETLVDLLDEGQDARVRLVAAEKILTALAETPEPATPEDLAELARSLKARLASQSQDESL